MRVKESKLTKTKYKIKLRGLSLPLRMTSNLKEWTKISPYGFVKNPTLLKKIIKISIKLFSRKTPTLSLGATLRLKEMRILLHFSMCPKELISTSSINSMRKRLRLSFLSGEYSLMMSFRTYYQNISISWKESSILIPYLLMSTEKTFSKRKLSQL